MEAIKDKIQEFFREYANRFKEGLAGKADTDATTAAFADFFVEASPVGISGGCISKLRFLVFGIKKVLYPQVFSPFGLLFG